jgi:hypothetical protein
MCINSGADTGIEAYVLLRRVQVLRRRCFFQHLQSLLIRDYGFASCFDYLSRGSVNSEGLVCTDRVDGDGAEAGEDGRHEFVAAHEAEIFVRPVGLQD